jgi:hypothetical protein
MQKEMRRKLFEFFPEFRLHGYETRVLLIDPNAGKIAHEICSKPELKNAANTLNRILESLSDNPIALASQQLTGTTLYFSKEKGHYTESTHI